MLKVVVSVVEMARLVVMVNMVDYGFNGCGPCGRNAWISAVGNVVKITGIMVESNVVKIKLGSYGQFCTNNGFGSCGHCGRNDRFGGCGKCCQNYRFYGCGQCGQNNRFGGCKQCSKLW